MTDSVIHLQNSTADPRYAHISRTVTKGGWKRRWLVVATILVAWWQLLPAATVAYDIVYVRAPRAGNDKQTSWADVFHPMQLQPGSDLMLLHPDGTEETLVAGGKGAVADPCVSFDAQWVYYSYLPDPLTVANNVPTTGADIYKIQLKTHQVVRLTQQEYTPNTSVRTEPLPYGIFNMGPCPVSGGKVVFTSNRNGFIPPKQYTPVTSQLYVMNDDGTEVTPIAPMTLGAALHPFQLKDGRIAFSTQEAQGMRDQRVWALWAIWPDGRAWEPLLSAFAGGHVFHFATQLSGGDIVVEDYYNLNNMGFGSFQRFPTDYSPDGARFHSAFPSDNPPVVYTNVNGGRQELRYPFSPIGMFTATPFTTPQDEAGPLITYGSSTDRAGKVTLPSAAPNNDLLLVWSAGPVNLLPRPVTTPAPDAGLYIARNGGPVEKYSDLVLIKNDPRYNEIWPRAVVPYRAIYGVDEPIQFPFLPNDGTLHPSLPAGTPYGIIGTSSFYKRESFPGYAAPGASYDGLESFNAAGEFLGTNWNLQGSDVGKYTNSEIASVRIVMEEPTSEGKRKWFNHVNERLRILGEIPLLKSHADGSTVRDQEGNPDTSFWAKVPANTPFTFQMLDREGRLLTMAQTWHQVRPGEIRTNCGGCHAHSQTPLAFEGTAAAHTSPVDLTTTPVKDVEFVRDIRPILRRSCVSCHRGSGAPAGLAFDDETPVAGAVFDSPEVVTPGDYARLARDSSARWGIKPVQKYGWIPPNGSRYVRILQSRRSLLVWKLFGARLDGWTNEQWPTETTPGDASTLPGGQTAQMADLNYSDTVNHAAMLSVAEKRLVATWIDLAAPIDLGGGYWQDEVRPTLTIKVLDGTLLVGAADAYSGLDESSLSLTIDGDRTSLDKVDTGVWFASVSRRAVMATARVKDRAGNWAEQTARLSSVPAASASRTSSTAPRPPTNVRIVR